MLRTWCRRNLLSGSNTESTVPKPEQPPENYPVWPLWFVSWAFYHNKRAGLLFVLGLVINLLVPISS